MMGTVRSQLTYLAQEEIVSTPGVGAGIPLLAHTTPHLCQNPVRPARMDFDLMPESQSPPRCVNLQAAPLQKACNLMSGSYNAAPGAKTSLASRQGC